MGTFWQAVTGIGVVAFALAQWANGKTKKKGDRMEDANNTIDLLNKRITAQESRIGELETANVAQRDEITRLDERVKLYREVLQNRNPEMVEFMRVMEQHAVQSAEYMKATSDNLRAINVLMEKLNAHLGANN